MRDDIKQGFMDKVYGAIYGQAIGDALGHPIEFQKTHLVSGLEDDNKFTDDTQMFCAIGEALLEAPPKKTPRAFRGERGSVSEDAFMEVLSKKFIEWRNNPLGGSHRAPGGTCMEAVRKLGAGRHWRQAGATAVGKGNGSAMRAGIVGARFWKDPEYAFRIGCLTSINTHNNLEAILGAGMVAFLVAASIAGMEWETAVAIGLVYCSEFATRVPEYPTNSVPLNDTRDGQSPWKAITSFARAFVLGHSERNGTTDFLAVNGDDFTVVPAVSEAIYFNTTHGDHLEGMLIECANTSDDSDTITAITGTIIGARVGIADIPEEWVKKIEMTSYLNDLAGRIFDASLEENSTDTLVEQVFDIEDDEQADAIARAVDSGALDTVETLTEEDDFEVEF
jgi:ADP-ribosylglycohydrolase